MNGEDRKGFGQGERRGTEPELLVRWNVHRTWDFLDIELLLSDVRELFVLGPRLDRRGFRLRRVCHVGEQVFRLSVTLWQGSEFARGSTRIPEGAHLTLQELDPASQERVLLLEPVGLLTCLSPESFELLVCTGELAKLILLFSQKLQGRRRVWGLGSITRFLIQAGHGSELCDVEATKESACELAWLYPFTGPLEGESRDGSPLEVERVVG